MNDLKKQDVKHTDQCATETQDVTSDLGFVGRLKQLIGNQSPYAFATKAGLSSASIKSCLDSGEPLTGKNLFKLSTYTGASIDWLLLGQGDMYLSKKNNSENQSVFEEFVLLPRYSVEASAGTGSLIEAEDEIGKLAFRRDWILQKGLNIKDLAVISIRGDSMTPTIRDRSLVLVDCHKPMKIQDGVYVLLHDGLLMAKRLQIDFYGGIHIRSDNPAYEVQTIAPEFTDRLSIIGRVVWSGGEL